MTTKQLAEEIDRVRQFLEHGDKTGWKSKQEEHAVVLALYDLLISNARMKADRKGTRGDSVELDITLDPEMVTLLQRLTKLEERDVQA